MPVSVTPVQLERYIMAGGRLMELSALYAVHHACPCPSRVPAPVMEIFVRLLPEMKSLVSGKLPYASIIRVAPAAISKFRLLFSVIGPLKKIPAGTSTVSPLPAAVIAACMDVELSAAVVVAL